MRDYELKALDNYNMTITGTRKMRGAFFCGTEDHPYLLAEANGNEERIRYIKELQEYLMQQGLVLIDIVCPDREGRLITPLPTARYDDGRRYLVKRWFQGRECNLQKVSEVEEAARNLASLHVAGARILQEGNQSVCEKREDLADQMARRNQELRKIRSFIRKKQRKTEFDFLYLRAYEEIIKLAETAMFAARSLPAEAVSTIVHGSYNYHNVLMTSEGVATVNFDHVHLGNPMEDFYYFLRKCMEKYGWSLSEGERIFKAYEQIRPLTRMEKDYLYVRLLYPEKCWKVANTYYYSKKNGTGGRLEEKLKKALTAEADKKAFLAHLSAFHLPFSRV